MQDLGKGYELLAACMTTYDRRGRYDEAFIQASQVILHTGLTGVIRTPRHKSYRITTKYRENTSSPQLPLPFPLLLLSLKSTHSLRIHLHKRISHHAFTSNGHDPSSAFHFPLPPQPRPPYLGKSPHHRHPQLQQTILRSPSKSRRRIQTQPRKLLHILLRRQLDPHSPRYLHPRHRR